VHFGAIEIVIDLDLQQSFHGSWQQQVTTVGPLNLGQRKDCFDERIGDRNRENHADQRQQTRKIAIDKSFRPLLLWCLFLSLIGCHLFENAVKTQNFTKKRIIFNNLSDQHNNLVVFDLLFLQQSPAQVNRQLLKLILLDNVLIDR